MDVQSRGAQTVIDAMRRHGVRRLVVQTSYGVGESRALLPLASRLVFALLLAPQIADTERQARALHASGLDWVEAQPVNLTDDDVAVPAFVSTIGEQRSARVARRQVAAFLADAVESDEHVGQTFALSYDPDPVRRPTSPTPPARPIIAP